MCLGGAREDIPAAHLTEKMATGKREHQVPVLSRIAWNLAWPIRLFVTCFPVRRGKGLLIRWFLQPLLPTGTASYLADLPGGGRIELRYRERIGLSRMIHGKFESAETTFLIQRAKPGTTAIDAGANVGLFTIPLARAVGSAGTVLAFEPSPENVERLRRNIALNALKNVAVYDSALGETCGKAWLHVEGDPAYHTLRLAGSGRRGAVTEVNVLRLDDAWNDVGRPQVSVVKIDVEGSEALVLRGADALLEACRPTILVEAATRNALSKLAAWLEPRGFERVAMPSMEPWNVVFLPRV
jgi:FkbM family methyltransferase